MRKTKKNEKSNLAKNLILARFDMGMSGERFAEYLEIPYGTLRDIEAGISQGRYSTKLKIAKKLGTTVETLDGPTPGEKAEQSEKSDLLLRLYTIAPTLHEDELRGVLSIVESMPSRLTVNTTAKIKGS